MKKFLLLIVALLIFLPLATAESWDDYQDLDRMWDGQKSITNKQFEEVMSALESKVKQKEIKQRKKKIKKISGSGESLHNELKYDKEIQEITPLKNKEEGLLLNTPVHLYINENYLEKGFYKIIARKDADKKIYLMFYQSQFFKGEIEANETDDDYEEETLDFVRLVPYNESFVKIIFGGIDFNAYAFIPFSE